MGAFVIQNIMTGLLLTVNSLGGPGYPVLMYPALGTSNQSWINGGSTTIFNLENGFALTAANYTDSNCNFEVGVTAELLSGKPGQRWGYDSEQKSYYVQNSQSFHDCGYFYLTVADTDLEGSPLLLGGTVYGSSSQQFQTTSFVAKDKK